MKKHEKIYLKKRQIQEKVNNFALKSPPNLPKKSRYPHSSDPGSVTDLCPLYARFMSWMLSILVMKSQQKVRNLFFGNLANGFCDCVDQCGSVIGHYSSAFGQHGHGR